MNKRLNVNVSEKVSEVETGKNEERHLKTTVLRGFNVCMTVRPTYGHDLLNLCEDANKNKPLS